MLGRLLGLPLVVLILGIGALAMFLPAIHASITDDHETARAFFYSGVLFLVLFFMVAVATSRMNIRRQARSHLISLLSTYTVIPLMLAVPVSEVVRDTSFLNAYFEMVSSLTTTGATLFAPDRLPSSVHLWRAEVGWLGGFFAWLTAVAVLAPMNLGGFEVRSSGAAQIGSRRGRATIADVAPTSERLMRFALQLFPIYTILTLILWVLLYITGAAPLVSLCHAMSIMATSGISPIGPVGSGGGIAGEAFMALFLIFALSRVTFASDERPLGLRSVWQDAELRLGLLLVAVLPLVMAGRHWFGAFELRAEDELVAFFQAFWGAAFTTISYLTTTGFESVHWETARGWSGLEAPGLVLLGLAVFGGGVATTAGGVKLLRVFALYKHGMRELEKLVHPHSIGGSGRDARRIRRQGAQVAWIFFMLFAISIAGFMLLFAMTGVDFDAAMVLTIAGLTTTGPLTQSAGSAPIELATLSDFALMVLAAAMVVGRLETLAIVALLNPDFWRS